MTTLPIMPAIRTILRIFPANESEIVSFSAKKTMRCATNIICNEIIVTPTKKIGCNLLFLKIVISFSLKVRFESLLILVIG
jgi:hypothetical protein